MKNDNISFTYNVMYCTISKIGLNCDFLFTNSAATYVKKFGSDLELKRLGDPKSTKFT